MREERNMPMKSNNILKIAITLLVLVVLVGINFLTSAIVKSNPLLKADLTPDKFFTLSKESKQFGKSVTKPVKMYGLINDNYKADPVSLGLINKSHILAERLAATNRRLSFEALEINTEEQAAKIAKYENGGEPITILSIILDDGSGFEIATPIIIQGQGSVDFSEFEKTLTNALRKLASPETPEINVPLKNEAEPEEFKLTDSRVNNLITVFTIVIPLILFAVAGFLGCVRKRRLLDNRPLAERKLSP
jgi:hypothetical protein